MLRLTGGLRIREDRAKTLDMIAELVFPILAALLQAVTAPVVLEVMAFSCVGGPPQPASLLGGGH
jgi:hypothetical protein